MFVYLYFSSPFKDWTFSTFHLWITKIGIGAFNFEWREWKSACWCCWIGISRVQFLLMIFTTKWIKFKEKLTLTKFRSWKLILNRNSREYRIVDRWFVEMKFGRDNQDITKNIFPNRNLLLNGTTCNRVIRNQRSENLARFCHKVFDVWIILVAKLLIRNDEFNKRIDKR